MIVGVVQHSDGRLYFLLLIHRLLQVQDMGIKALGNYCILQCQLLHIIQNNKHKMQINGEGMSRRIQYEDEDRDCYTQISGRNNNCKKQEIISQELDTHSMQFDSQFYTSNLRMNHGQYMSEYNNDNEVYEQDEYNLDQDETAEYDCANDKVKHPYGSKRIRTIQFITINNTHHWASKHIKNMNASSSKPKLKILSSSRKRDPTQSTFANKTIYSQLNYEKLTNNVSIKMKQDKQDKQTRTQQAKIINRKRGPLSIGDNLIRNIQQNQMNNTTAMEQNIQIKSHKQVNKTPMTKSRNQPIVHSSRQQQKTKQFDSQTTHQNNTGSSTIVNQTPMPTNSQPNSSGNDVNMSKVVSQIIIQNNEYLHRLNESVVNRLLSIIQNTQNATIALQNSRWTQSNSHQINPNKNHNVGSNEPSSAFFNDHTQYNNGQPIHDFSARRRDCSHADMSHNNSSNKMMDQQEKLSIKNPHIVINNLIPTSTKSQPHSHNVSLISNGNMNGKQLDTEIKIKENELSKLENKRRYRQFNMRTPRLSNCSIVDNCQSQINQDTFRSNLNNTTQNMVDNSVLEEQHSQIKHKRNRESVSMQCDQILQAPMQNQKQEFSESFHPTFGNNRNMSKTRKVKQVQASKMSVNQNHLMSHTAPNIPLKQYSSQSNILRQNTQKSVQLPVSNKNNVSKVISVEQNLNISNLTEKLPVFMEIPSGEEQSNLGSMTLAQAFKKRIGKLPSRAQRKAKEMQKQNENKKLQQQKSQQMQTVALKQRVPNKNIMANRAKRTRNKIDQTNNLELDVRALNGKSQDNSYFKTPKSREPSEQLLNRLIGGSVAKISKKQMYALTRKNYQNLPQVLEKKKKEEKKQLQAQRLQRIKEYQKSIRASKTTITSNN